MEIITGRRCFGFDQMVKGGTKTIEQTFMSTYVEQAQWDRLMDSWFTCPGVLPGPCLLLFIAALGASHVVRARVVMTEEFGADGLFC